MATSAADDPDDPNVTRVFIVGSRGIGKTCLARTIADGAFPSADFLAHSLQDDKAMTLKYRTTATGAFKFGDCKACYHIELKELVSAEVEACPKWEDIRTTQLVLLCFDVTNNKSFEAIREFFMPKISKEIQGKKNKPLFILVGLKEDAKGSSTHADVQPITPAVAQELANEIGASSYVETSSLKNIGIDLLKEKLVFGRMENSKPYKEKVQENRCILL